MEIGGNRFLYSMGTRFKKWGEKLITRGKPMTITNPSAKLANPFTLIVSFTVDTSEKYQLVVQGKYRERYKESEDGNLNLSEDELHIIITSKRKNWFKKNE